MVNDYLSFDNFEKKDLEDFLKLLPRDLLVIPITKKKKYGKEIGIKGFRPESYQLSTIRRIYTREIISEKRNSYLGHCLLLWADNIIKKDVSNEEYKLLSEKKYTSRELDLILNKLFDIETIDSKYLLLMLGLDEEQKEKYINISFDKKLSEQNIQIKKRDEEIQKLKSKLKSLTKKLDNEKLNKNKIKKENDILVQNYKEIKNENENLKKELEKTNEENDDLNEKIIFNNNHLDFIIKNDIMNKIFGGENNINSNNINALYKSLNFQNFDNYLSVIYEKKIELFNEEDFKTVNDIIFIEYILTKLKEIEKNGQKQ